MQLKTRAALLVILAAVLVTDATWLGVVGPYRIKRSKPADQERERTNFTLKLFDTNSVVYPEGPVEPMPRFDPKTGRWTLQGKALADLSKAMIGMEVGPHGSSPVVVVQLPDDATIGDYQDMLTSLAAQGVCQVAVYGPPPARETLPPNPFSFQKGEASAYRVLNLTRNGVVQSCRDRFPPWIDTGGLPRE